MHISKVTRVHTLVIQREALLRLLQVAKPIGRVEVDLHGAVDEITRQFGADGLGLRLYEEIRCAKADAETELTAMYRRVVQERLLTVERELREMGVDLTPEV